MSASPPIPTRPLGVGPSSVVGPGCNTRRPIDPRHRRSAHPDLGISLIDTADTYGNKAVRKTTSARSSGEGCRRTKFGAPMIAEARSKAQTISSYARSEPAAVTD
jgi:aryl-alcohol dehydrogenase-like predicted oxidoreductase